MSKSRWEDLVSSVVIALVCFASARYFTDAGVGLALTFALAFTLGRLARRAIGARRAEERRTDPPDAPP